MNFWPIFDSSFSYKSAKNKINLSSRTEEACSMNIQSKNQLNSLNTFFVIVVIVSKKIVFRKCKRKKFDFLERTRWKSALTKQFN